MQMSRQRPASRRGLAILIVTELEAEAVGAVVKEFSKCALREARWFGASSDRQGLIAQPHLIVARRNPDLNTLDVPRSSGGVDWVPG
jgi:hypothetical protein